MQIKNKFFLRLFVLSFVPFLVLSLVAVYLFNQGIGQVISPGFENSLQNAEYLVENNLELYRVRFLNLIDVLAQDSLSAEDTKYFDLIIFVSQSDTIFIKPLDNPEYNQIFMEETQFRPSTFPEIMTFERKILVYQQIALNPTLNLSPMLIVGQYLPAEFSQKASEIISAKTKYGRLKMFVQASGSNIAWFLWLCVTVVYLTFILYVARWWANSLIRPINNLSLAAFDIAKGQWGKTVNYRKEDELGTLVTSFNYMSSELRKNAEKLLQAEIEASWKNTARIIAHGIKNILSPTKIALHNLQESKDLSKANDEIASIRSEIAKLEDIANDFSMFARSPDIRPVLVKVKKVSMDAMELAGKDFPEVEKKIHVNDDLYLETDYELLRSLMVNLLKNSMEAVTTNGVVEVSAYKDEAGVTIKIKDNGMGVPDEYREKIWIPYYTTKPRGTGLGLPIAQKFADALGAEIGLESDKNGTVVTIEFG
jgi:nitrogen fixation/metabolism regulation signal transduction histidine kinase